LADDKEKVLFISEPEKKRKFPQSLDDDFTYEFLVRCISDPLVHHGRHFGRTLHAMTNVKALLTNGLLRLGELAEQPEETFTAE
jgi:hypothetical protein